MHKCAVCLATDKPLSKCVKCKAACYCSQVCQRSDWPTHKKTCSVYKSTTVNLLTEAIPIFETINKRVSEKDFEGDV